MISSGLLHDLLPNASHLVLHHYHLFSPEQQMILLKMTIRSCQSPASNCRWKVLNNLNSSKCSCPLLKSSYRLSSLISSTCLRYGNIFPFIKLTFVLQMFTLAVQSVWNTHLPELSWLLLNIQIFAPKSAL